MKYRKKPINVEAVQHVPENAEVMKQFLGDSNLSYRWYEDPPSIYIDMDGQSFALSPGWWLIRYANQFEAMDPEMFNENYEAVDEAP